MNLLGVILNPLDWQKQNYIARPVDPAGVEFEAIVEYRLYLDWDPVMYCGTVKVEHTDNGGIYGTATLTDFQQEIKDRGPLVFAAGVKNPPAEEGATIYQSKLVCVGLCDKSSDDNQPAVEVVE